MELMIAAGKAVPRLQLEHGLAVDRVYTGSFVTSLNMAGLLFLESLSVCRINRCSQICVFGRIFNFCHEG